MYAAVRIQQLLKDEVQKVYLSSAKRQQIGMH